MKKTLLLITLFLSIGIEGRAQKPVPSPDKLSDAAPCVPRQTPKRIKRPVQTVASDPVEPAADFFVGEAMVEVTKDQTVVRLAMAQHASVLIELPANDGPRYIIPGDPEMVTVDEKALERTSAALSYDRVRCLSCLLLVRESTRPRLRSRRRCAVAWW